MSRFFGTMVLWFALSLFTACDGVEVRLSDGSTDDDIESLAEPGEQEARGDEIAHPEPQPPAKIPPLLIEPREIQIGEHYKVQQWQDPETNVICYSAFRSRAGYTSSSGMAMTMAISCVPANEPGLQIPPPSP